MITRQVVRERADWVGLITNAATQAARCVKTLSLSSAEATSTFLSCHTRLDHMCLADLALTARRKRHICLPNWHCLSSRVGRVPPELELALRSPEHCLRHASNYTPRYYSSRTSFVVTLRLAQHASRHSGHLSLWHLVAFRTDPVLVGADTNSRHMTSYLVAGGCVASKFGPTCAMRRRARRTT